MKIFILVICLNGVPQLTFPIDKDANCEWVAQHPAVVGSYRQMFGNEVSFYCQQVQ